MALERADAELHRQLDDDYTMHVQKGANAERGAIVAFVEHVAATLAA